ncbi:MAG TPA: aminopeptidase [Burkholderiales bacterium]|nr:aminopeptidase [Burkholderiales bacterium]
MSRFLRSFLFLTALGAVAIGAGCSTLGYYWQAFDGQMNVLRSARPINEVIDDPHVGQDVKVKLEHVRQIREFATKDLGLPDNGSYRRYADLKRRYVVWNVFATDEFSVQPKEWCFPIAGCVGYRGYFDEAAAERFADSLRQQGLDVYVAGVPAYSTLGWLDDPILNTFINYPETELARLIFHELSHQVAYAKGDTTFNESFAVTVENEGVERWVQRFGTPQQRAAYAAAQQRKADFLALVETYRERLGRLYEAGGDPQPLRVAKAKTFDDMRADYVRLKAKWGGFAGYDWWFAQPMNNAQLASVAIYTQLVGQFEALLARDGGDLKRFYADVKNLTKLPEDERRARLEEVQVSRAD